MRTAHGSDQHKGRKLDEYFRHLEQGFQRRLEGLRPGQIYFDGGAGLGIAALQVASARADVRVVAANLKNFWNQFFTFAEVSRDANFRELRERKIQDTLADFSVAIERPVTNVASAQRAFVELPDFSYREGTVRATLRSMIARGEKIEVVGKWPETIVIRKVPGRDSLDLGLRMVPGTVSFTPGAAFPIDVRYDRR